MFDTFLNIYLYMAAFNMLFISFLFYQGVYKGKVTLTAVKSTAKRKKWTYQETLDDYTKSLNELYGKGKGLFGTSFKARLFMGVILLVLAAITSLVAWWFAPILKVRMFKDMICSDYEIIKFKK